MPCSCHGADILNRVSQKGLVVSSLQSEVTQMDVDAWIRYNGQVSLAQLATLKWSRLQDRTNGVWCKGNGSHSITWAVLLLLHSNSWYFLLKYFEFKYWRETSSFPNEASWSFSWKGPVSPWLRLERFILASWWNSVVPHLPPVQWLYALSFTMQNDACVESCNFHSAPWNEFHLWAYLHHLWHVIWKSTSIWNLGCKL